MLEQSKTLVERIPLLGPLVRRYRNYTRWIMTSGNITSTSPLLIGFGRWMLRAWAHVQVGRIKVVGLEHLSTPGRVIFCPNHSSFLDAIVVGSIMQRPVRYMGAYESMEGMWGLKPIFCCKFGAFPVDRAHGKTVLGPATKLLVSGEPLMIFPEGKIDNTGKLGELKLGAGYITRATCDQLGNDVPVGIVPMHICYHKRNIETGDTFDFRKIGLTWRGGVTVFVGEPIWVNKLKNRDPENIMKLVRDGILSFDCKTSGKCLETVPGTEVSVE